MSLPVGGTSYQALNSSGTRARSKSPLDGLEGEDPFDTSPASTANPLSSSSSLGYAYQSANGASQNHGGGKDPSAVRARQEAFLASRAAQPQNFTFRGVAVGLIIGTIICLSNTYFGLQTGWISGMAMPASLLGFAWFRTFSKFLTMPFTPVENVLVQCVAGAVGTMPLGVGLVGVIPALERLTKEGEGGPMNISLFRLVVWSVGVCFFGVFVAVPLRREMLVREKLKFPSGTATGLMISVLHADSEALEQKKLTDEGLDATPSIDPRDDDAPESSASELSDPRNDWKRNIRDLLVAYLASSIYTLFSYFVPHVRELPIFGMHLSKVWEWKLNPSPAYVGQGIIMGPATTIHMLFGALLGWAILSPLAKDKGWAPGKVGDWEDGSKGWIVWVSLAIMLADSLVNLGWLILRPVMLHGPEWYARLRAQHKEGRLRPSAFWSDVSRGAYQPIIGSGSGSPRHRGTGAAAASSKFEDEPEADAPVEHLPSQRASLIGLGVSVILCIVGTHIAFPGMIPLHATVLAVAFSLILSVAGVRALGETDLNPVSGISKVTQLVFAAILPLTPASIPANLIAGAISESAALQAGDMMQDLKTGHLLGASPLAQFYGQILGSAAGAVIASLVYKLYTHVYTIPGEMFQMPTGFMWIMTARLVTGQGLPPQAGKAALIAGALWAVLTVVRIHAQGRWWQSLVPGGIAVAVGMYNTPSFTLARTVGGLLSLWWTRFRKGREEPLVILASGLILGEGVVSIVNLVLASFKVPALKGW